MKRAIVKTTGFCSKHWVITTAVGVGLGVVMFAAIPFVIAKRKKQKELDELDY